MAITVTVGKDTVQFPDGMADADIKAALDKEYGSQRAPATKSVQIGPSVKGVTAFAEQPLDGLPAAQKAAVLGHRQSQDYDPTAPHGDIGNPIIQTAAAPVPVGKAYIDPAGQLHSSNPGQSDEGLGLLKGFVKPIANATEWADNGLQSIGLPRIVSAIEGRPSGYPSLNQSLDTKVSDAAAQGRKPGLLGQVAGNLVSGLPLTMATKNPFLGGALIGAANTKDPNSGVGTGTDAAIGAVTGGLGDMGVRQLGAMIAPRLNPLVQKLLDEGVHLTPGQTLGGMAHRLEDATRSIYGLGDLVIGAQSRAQKSLNRVAVQRTLSPIGVQIPHDMPEGHAQIGFAQKTLGDAYHAVLNDIDKHSAQTGTTMPVPHGMVTPGGLHLDPQFGSAVGTLRKMAQAMPQDQAHVFESFVQGEMKHAFGPNGSISGPAMKTLDELLGKNARQFRSSPNPHDRNMGQAFGELQNELRDMVGRQFPQHAKTLDAINQGYANLTRLEPIAANAEGGVFTAPALRAGTVAADKTIRHRKAGAGEALMQDLGNAASTVMKNTIPDSGTPARALASAGAGYALFGNPIHGIHINPWAAGLLGGLGLPYINKTTGNVARTLISQRPAGAAAVRSVVDKMRPAATAIAASNQSRQQ